MPWTKKQKGFFGARCGEGESEYCDLLKHHGTKKEGAEEPVYTVRDRPDGGVDVTVPEGNTQGFKTKLAAEQYIEWHASLDGRSPVIRRISAGTPKMTEVFHVSEAPMQNRPPPGAQPVGPTDWNKMGRVGQNLKQSLDGMKNTGHEMTPYSTPDGQQVAYPKQAAPGVGPMRADTAKGVWSPVTGSATGLPTSSSMNTAV